VDELCDEIDELGDKSSALWSKKAAKEDEIIIAHIKCDLNRISRLRVMLEEYVSRAAKTEMVGSEQEFFREVSGGEFENHRRAADILKSYLVLQSATSYVMTVRSAHLKDQKGMWRRH
jgi:hypothetical protein